MAQKRLYSDRHLCLLPSATLYADDLAIWFSVPTAVEATQGVLIRLEHWSKYWCLPPRENVSLPSKWIPIQPYLRFINSRLRFNPTPTFLGVTFNRTQFLTCILLKAKFFPCLKALRCIFASSWDLSKLSFSVLYKAFFGYF